jgi:hypothetical protein
MKILLATNEDSTGAFLSRLGGEDVERVYSQDEFKCVY